MTEATSKNPARDKALRDAYAAATKTLRETHRPEFDRLVALEAQARGEVYTPRLSKLDKARAKIAALIAEHPELAPSAPQA